MLGPTAIILTPGMPDKCREKEQPAFWTHQASFWKTQIEHVQALKEGLELYRQGSKMQVSMPW